MMAEVCLLTRLELRGLLGLNRLRYDRDPKRRGRAILVLAAFALLAVMAAAYTVGLVYGLHSLDMGRLAPAYLSMVCALLVLGFGLLKTGSLLFARGGYEMLCALPVRTCSIVLSRFLSMYVCDLGMTLLVLVPGTVTYGLLEGPGFGFYAAMAAGAVLLPLLPLSVAAVAGTLIAWAASRMKRKHLASTLLSMLTLLVILPLSFGLGMAGENMTPDAFSDLAQSVAQLIGRLYPPALWLGKGAVEGSLSFIALLAVCSLGAVTAIVALAAKLFHPICRRLFASAARKDFKMTAQTVRSPLAALYRRELKAYFSSSVYVMNTIVGPVMALMMAGALAFGGMDALKDVFPPQLELQTVMPFVLAGVMTMMTTTAVALSMEGRRFWLVKSLPVSTKSLLDAKLLVQLTLLGPCWLLGEGLLLFALRPTGADIVWLLLFPALIALFAAVAGLTVDVRFCNFEWEKAEAVVKQSAGAMVGGLAGPLAALLCGLARFAAPASAEFPVNAGLCVLLAGTTLALYRKNNKVKLDTL